MRSKLAGPYVLMLSAFACIAASQINRQAPPLGPFDSPAATAGSQQPASGKAQALHLKKRTETGTSVQAAIARDVAPASHVQITLNTKNVPVIQIKAYPVDPVQWLKSLRANPNKPESIGEPVKAWSVSVATKDNPPNRLQADRYYSRQVNLPPLRPGVYRLDISGGGANTWAVVNVTELGVIVKESPKHVLVWVTNAINGRTIDDARVLIFEGKTGRPKAEGKTGADGTFSCNLRPGVWRIVVNRGQDYAGVPSDGEDPNGHLVAHFQTDRPVYRPGQTIQFKAILRMTQDTGYRVPSDTDVQIELRDPKDNPIDRLQLHSNQMGSVAGSFEIPGEGAIGPYSLVLSMKDQHAYQSINVAEYRKPEYKVDIAPLEKRYLAGDKIRFKVSAEYYFGAPVGQAEIHYSVRRDMDPNWSYGAFNDGANYYPNDAYNLAPFVAEDTVHTDNNGEAVIEIKSDPKAPDSVYDIHCTINDASRREVDGDASVPVYAASIRLSITTDALTIPLGKLIPLSLQAQDLDGKPCVADVALIESHQVWNEKTGDYKTVELTRTRLHIPSSGQAKASMPAEAEDEIYIEARAYDPTKRLASDVLETYVVGPKEKLEREQKGPEVEAKINRKSYSPGETVAVHISANTKNWPILVVAEGQDIYGHKVLDGSGDWSFRTAKDMSPNAYLSAAQWVKGQLYTSNTMVPIPDPDVALTVHLTPDKPEYRPGDQATYQVRTVDKNGKPVPAEVAINVVDAAIYAISPDNTPNLHERFWGQRPNEVVMHQAAPEELSGGAYQNAAADFGVTIRTRFVDTAYWNAFVETGADGNGEISFEMPGNLTTWQAWARAVDEKSQVGTADSSVIATRPVTLRLATPRQIDVGDHLVLIGTVDNRTAESHEFKVSLKADGLQLDSASEQTLTVPAKGEGTLQWQLSANQIGASAASLTGEAQCTDVSETERPGFSDALRMTFPIKADGVPIDIKAGGVVANSATSTLLLPADKIEPATKTTVRIWSGAKPELEKTVRDVLAAFRFGTLPAADQLELWPLSPDTDPKELREILAHLSRAQQSDGWGYWDSCKSDPIITAAVLRAISLAKGVSIPKNLVIGAQRSAEWQYEHTNLWEYRALLASALELSGDSKGGPWLDEVAARGMDLSPYAKLRLAEGFLALGDKERANAQIEAEIPNVSESQTSAYLPVGDGIGWSANAEETTAELLKELIAAGTHAELQSKLAEWLVAPQDDYWPSLEDQAGKALALHAYLDTHSAPTSIGQATVEVGGTSYPAKKARIQDELIAEIPSSALAGGENSITIRRQGEGEAFFEVDSTVYRPLRTETDEGVRVARRFEVQNSAGIWEEVHRPVKAGEVIRCTALVWGDAVPDVIRLISPIPAGFEYVDADESGYTGQSETEVRDAAVVYYVVTEGKPVFLSYYIRPESEGDVDALPASAEILRRPDRHGLSDAQRVSVGK